MLGTWPRPSSAISRSSHPSICPSIDPSSTPSFTSSRPLPPCTLVLQAGASYPTCGRGVGSPIIALASKPEPEISAPLLHALLIRPDGILGRIAPDPAYKVDEQQALPSTSCKHLRVHGHGHYCLAWHRYCQAEVRCRAELEDTPPRQSLPQ